MRRDGNPSFTLIINHRLQPSYHVTLNPLIVLSVVYRETLLGGRDQLAGVGLRLNLGLLPSISGFWVVPRAPGSSRARFSVLLGRKCFLRGRRKRTVGRKIRLGCGPQGLDLGALAEVLCSQNFSRSTFPYRFLRSEKRPNCLCFKATVVPPNSLYK